MGENYDNVFYFFSFYLFMGRYRNCRNSAFRKKKTDKPRTKKDPPLARLNQTEGCKTIQSKDCGLLPS